jgi:hypothetical protein
MHYADMTLCRYASDCLNAAAWSVPLRAVGWLEHPHPFTVEAQPPGLAQRLTLLIEQTSQHLPHERFRGFHLCSLCEAREQRFESPWSQVNVIVPGACEVFAAPGTIVHYIEVHGYTPPAAFVTAVMECPDVGSPAYFEALRAANGGTPPPLETREEFHSRIQSQIAATLRSRQR